MATIPRDTPPPRHIFVKPPSLESTQVKASTSRELASHMNTEDASTPTTNECDPVSAKIVITDYENTSNGMHNIQNYIEA